MYFAYNTYIGCVPGSKKKTSLPNHMISSIVINHSKKKLGSITAKLIK